MDQPQFQANRPQGTASNVIQQQAPPNHKQSVLGTLAGVGIGAATGNWAPLVSHVLGGAAGGVMNAAQGDQTQEQPAEVAAPDTTKTSESSTGKGPADVNSTTPGAPPLAQPQLPPEVYAALTSMGMFGQPPGMQLNGMPQRMG